VRRAPSGKARRTGLRDNCIKVIFPLDHWDGLGATVERSATNLKDRRIRVNAVSPGPIETPGLTDLVAFAGAGEQRLKTLSDSVPLGRLGAPMRSRRRWCFSPPTAAAMSW
jgi:NAD(P)-dependent dehydrogenase (short-subunit alcohol dehydrogenase family)